MEWIRTKTENPNHGRQVVVVCENGVRRFDNYIKPERRWLGVTQDSRSPVIWWIDVGQPKEQK